MVNVSKVLNGFLIIEIAFISAVVGLHYQHQRPQPPPRPPGHPGLRPPLGPRPPPPRPPPPNTPGQGQNPPPYNHVTPASYPTQYPYQNYPQPNPHTATHHPPPAFNPNAASQPPPPAYNPHGQLPYPDPHAPQSNANPPYNYNVVTHAPPAAPLNNYNLPPHDAYQQPPAGGPYHQPQAGNTPQIQEPYQQPPVREPYQQPPAREPYQQPQAAPAQNDFYAQQKQYNQATNPRQSASSPDRQPTPPANKYRTQERPSHRQQTQPVNRRPFTETNYKNNQQGYSAPSAYAAEPNLPVPPTPLSESRRRRPVEDRRPSEQSVRYSEPMRDSFPARSDNVVVQTLDNRQPEAPRAESRYYQADQQGIERARVSDVRFNSDRIRSSNILDEPLRSRNEYGIQTDTIRTESMFSKRADPTLSEIPPGDIAYLKPKATVKAEYNHLKESEKRQRIPTEKQLLEIKRQQLELLKMLQKVQKTKSTKRENPYLKALYEGRPPVERKIQEEKPTTKPTQPEKCPMYKYDIEANRIEIHTEPGRCKILIKLPKDGKGEPKISYLARS